jgi:hypothetical protein
MTTRFFFAIALTAPLAVACTTSTVADEFAADETGDIDDSKADVSGGTYTYFTAERDMRRCASPMCGGWFVNKVNASMTKCHDGRNAERCYVAEADFAATGLGLAAIDRAMSAGANFSDQKLLVRGTIGRINTPAGVFGKFRVTEAWVGQGPNVPDGPFAKVEETGVRCITTPCPFFREKKLNSSATASLAEIGWDASGATEEQIGAAIEQLFINDVIVAGDRYTVTGPGGEGKARYASQFYTRVLDEKTCFVGGCSGQVCSDREGVITTCEWRDEYACYDTATCEVQGDGTCGWTQTEELDSCLAAAN